MPLAVCGLKARPAIPAMLLDDGADTMQGPNHFERKRPVPSLFAHNSLIIQHAATRPSRASRAAAYMLRILMRVPAILLFAALLRPRRTPLNSSLSSGPAILAASHGESDVKLAEEISSLEAAERIDTATARPLAVCRPWEPYPRCPVAACRSSAFSPSSALPDCRPASSRRRRPPPDHRPNRRRTRQDSSQPSKFHGRPGYHPVRGLAVASGNR